MHVPDDNDQNDDTGSEPAFPWRAFEDELGDALVSAKPVMYRESDAMHRAIGRCVGTPGAAPCPHVGIPGTVPPRCRSHGGLAPLSAAAAQLRLQAVKTRLQLELEPAIVQTVQKLLAIVNTQGPFLEGTVVETEQLSQKGDVVQVKDGVRIRAGDVIRAADRILLLTGITAEVVSFTGDVNRAEALEAKASEQDAQDISEDMSDPVIKLRKMLQAAPDDRLERLALRLGAGPAALAAALPASVRDDEGVQDSRQDDVRDDDNGDADNSSSFT